MENKNNTSIKENIRITYLVNQNLNNYEKLNINIINVLIKNVFTTQYTLIEGYYDVKNNKLLLRINFSDYPNSWYIGSLNNKEKQFLLFHKIKKYSHIK